MAGTTTNNGWDYPTSTDLVKDGALNIQTLAQDIDTSVGMGLLAWQSWAPTLAGGWANGNGTWTAAYAQLGKTVFVRGKFVVGSTTTKGSNMVISLPITANGGALEMTSISPALTVCAGSTVQLLFGYVTSTTQFTMFAMNAGGTYLTRSNVTSTVPATWATGDSINFAFSYQAA